MRAPSRAAGSRVVRPGPAVALRHRLRTLTVGLVLPAALLLGPAPMAHAGSSLPGSLAARLAAGACDRWAASAPLASDANPGTRRAPFRTVQRLWDALDPGETGCLVPGDVFRPASGQVVLFVPAADVAPAERPRILRTAPGRGGMAELRGTIEVQGEGVVLAGLRLNGASQTLNASAFILRGDRITLAGNDITTEGTRICIDVGYRMMEDFGHLVRDAVIDGNRIHHCGNATEPGSGEHGLYLQQSLRARVTNNFVHHNTDRGIQVYFESDEALIAHNVVDRNGSNLHVGGRLYEPDGYLDNGRSNRWSDHTTVERNIFSNATLFTRNSPRWSIETFWASDEAQHSGTIEASVTGNVLRRNCVHQPPADQAPADRTILPLDWGRSGLQVADDNVVGTGAASDPRYRDGAAGDHRLRPGSPCRGMGPLPGAWTRAVSVRSDGSIRSGGIVDPHWQTVRWWFEYGPTAGYGWRTPARSITGHLPARVSARIVPRRAWATLHVRLVVVSSAGRVNGGDRVRRLSPG